jgi:Domain of unknown function (DUF4537)
MWTTGDRVLAHRPPDDFWYPGVIRHIRDDRFFIIYDDGEDGFVKAAQMMPLNLEAGDHVFARTPPERDYAPARILDKQDDRLHLQYEAGHVAWAQTAQVRVRPEARKPTRADAPPQAWSIGDRVFACWFDLCWYSGSVLAALGDEVTVVFDHGGHAEMPAAKVRALELEVGDRIQGRWKAGADFYPGVVAQRDGEVVTIDYDDGDRETTLVRLLRLERDDWLPDTPPPVNLDAGDRVLGCWFDGFWYPGVILSVEGKRVHVLFDDNDQAFVTWDKVRPLEIAVGDRVFCRFKGGPFYHPGEVVRRHGERIFVAYEDGREEWSSVRLVRLELEPRPDEEGP